MRTLHAVILAVGIGTAGYWIGHSRAPMAPVAQPGNSPPTAQSRPTAKSGEALAPAVSAPPASAPAAHAASGFRAAAQRVRPSVVNIYTAQRVRRGAGNGWRPFVERGRGDDIATSLGSGVIVSADGYVLTNNHVIEGAEQIAVALPNGKTVPARTVGADPESDLAVLRVNQTGLAPIEFGDSNALQVGDVVLAVGDPFGVGQTVTQGIVSATGRNRVGINTFENFIQTDAAINPGNSGGALVDIDGRLVGINSAIFSQSGGSQGIGFAIPVSLAREVMDQIIATGRVERGWLGVQAQDVTPELAQRTGAKSGTGVLISAVARRSPAAAAGLQPGDVVTAIQGKAVPDAAALMAATAAIKPGSEVNVEVLRQAKPLSLRATLGERPAPARR